MRKMRARFNFLGQRPVLATCAVLGVAAATVTTASITHDASVTSATGAATEYSWAEYTAHITGVVLEGSNRYNADFTSSDAPIALTFNPEQMALAVGKENAVFTQLYLRTGANSDTGATVVLQENGLEDTPFGNALRAQVFQNTNANTCSRAGIDAYNDSTKWWRVASEPGPLRGHTTVATTLGGRAKPLELSADHEVKTVCVQVWLDNNDWLLGGEEPPEVTATWVATATPKQ